MNADNISTLSREINNNPGPFRSRAPSYSSQVSQSQLRQPLIHQKTAQNQLIPSLSEPQFPRHETPPKRESEVSSVTEIMQRKSSFVVCQPKEISLDNVSIQLGPSATLEERITSLADKQIRLNSHIEFRQKNEINLASREIVQNRENVNVHSGIELPSLDQHKNKKQKKIHKLFNEGPAHHRNIQNPTQTATVGQDYKYFANLFGQENRKAMLKDLDQTIKTVKLSKKTLTSPPSMGSFEFQKAVLRKQSMQQEIKIGRQTQQMQQKRKFFLPPRTPLNLPPLVSKPIVSPINVDLQDFQTKTAQKIKNLDLQTFTLPGCELESEQNEKQVNTNSLQIQLVSEFEYIPEMMKNVSQNQNQTKINKDQEIIVELENNIKEQTGEEEVKIQVDLSNIGSHTELNPIQEERNEACFQDDAIPTHIQETYQPNSEILEEASNQMQSQDQTSFHKIQIQETEELKQFSKPHSQEEIETPFLFDQNRQTSDLGNRKRTIDRRKMYQNTIQSLEIPDGSFMQSALKKPSQPSQTEFGVSPKIDGGGESAKKKQVSFNPVEISEPKESSKGSSRSKLSKSKTVKVKTNENSVDSLPSNLAARLVAVLKKAGSLSALDRLKQEDKQSEDLLIRQQTTGTSEFKESQKLQDVPLYKMPTNAKNQVKISSRKQQKSSFREMIIREREKLIARK